MVYALIWLRYEVTNTFCKRILRLHAICILLHIKDGFSSRLHQSYMRTRKKYNFSRSFDLKFTSKFKKKLYHASFITQMRKYKNWKQHFVKSVRNKCNCQPVTWLSFQFNNTFTYYRLHFWKCRQCNFP